MEKYYIVIFALILIGLICGSLLGIVNHNYELDKCNVLSSSTNQDYYNYELQNNCYFVLEKTGWHLFWSVLLLGIMGAMLLVCLGVCLGVILDNF